MNKQRRKQIEDIQSRLESLKEELKIIVTQEENYFDSKPEEWQFDSRGTVSENAINSLDEAFMCVEHAVAALGDIQ